MPPDSVILKQVPGTTSSSPDGATFLDNLFGSGSSAPTQRLFSMSLARIEDVRTQSLLGIGAISPILCPPPCSPTYLNILPSSSLGSTGYLHWRILLTSVAYTVFGDEQNGLKPTTQVLSLGASQVESTRSSPLAVFDSGGVPILVGTKAYADTIYGAYGVSASPDGKCEFRWSLRWSWLTSDRFPCSKQIALTFTFSGQSFAVHPLDMTWPDMVTDPSGNTCLGAIQVAAIANDYGDL